MAVSFIGGGNQRTRRKPPNIMLYISPWAWVEPTTSVVIGTDCIGSCKSNNHTITATTTPGRLRSSSLESQYSHQVLRFPDTHPCPGFHPYKNQIIYYLDIKILVIFAKNYTKNFSLKMAGPEYFFLHLSGQLISFHKLGVNFFFRQNAYDTSPPLIILTGLSLYLHHR